MHFPKVYAIFMGLGWDFSFLYALSLVDIVFMTVFVVFRYMRDFFARTYPLCMCSYDK